MKWKFFIPLLRISSGLPSTFQWKSRSSQESSCADPIVFLTHLISPPSLCSGLSGLLAIPQRFQAPCVRALCVLSSLPGITCQVMACPPPCNSFRSWHLMLSPFMTCSIFVESLSLSPASFCGYGILSPCLPSSTSSSFSLLCCWEEC